MNLLFRVFILGISNYYSQRMGSAELRFYRNAIIGLYSLSFNIEAYIAVTGISIPRIYYRFVINNDQINQDTIASRRIA